MRLQSLAAVLLLPFFAAGCGPHTGLDSRAAIGDCGMQHMERYAAAPIPDDVTASWVSGCAVVNFAIDPSGPMQAPEIVKQMPSGRGLGAQIIAFLERDTYAPGRATAIEHPFVAPDPATRFSVEVGFLNRDKRWNVVKRFGVGKVPA